MGVKETLTEQLKRIVRFLNEQKIDYALAGGLAFSALVEPRATIDIDLVVMMGESQLSDFKDRLKHEFRSILTHKEPIEFKRAKIWRAVNLIEDLELIFDFIFAESEFYRNVIERAFEIEFFGSKIKIVTLEDLILLKNIAYRKQDLADLDKIYQTYNYEIDDEYLKAWAKELNIRLYQNKFNGDI
jgi:predicted nucleotidyltransferase